MLRVLSLSILAFAACGGGALQNVRFVNKTQFTIAEVYVYSVGSPNHGASRGKLAPGATLDVKMKAGNIEVLGISEKIQINDKLRDVRQASTTIQLQRPAQMIFHDSDQPPPDLKNKDVFGAAFQLPAAKKEPEPAPEPEAPSP
jgi:hypothetical protein